MFRLLLSKRSISELLQRNIQRTAFICSTNRTFFATSVPLYDPSDPPSSSPPLPPTGIKPSASAAAPASPQASKIDSNKDNQKCAPDTSTILAYPYEVIDTKEKLVEAVRILSKATAIALDIEAFCTASINNKQLGAISLVQACSDARSVVYIFDVITLTKPVFVEHFRDLLTSTTIRKLFFDCRRDVEALSCQMGLKPERVLDLQLFFTALQWKLRSVNRRSGMTYVLKNVTGVSRQEGDVAVQTAMTLGNRPVWDIRPLPDHFLEYAAGDVRHLLLLSFFLVEKVGRTNVDPNLSQATSPATNNSFFISQLPINVSVEAVERLTQEYVNHYAIGKPVLEEADAKPAEVSIPLLERFIGPGGVCSFCGAKGHTEVECFKKQSGKSRCSFCGDTGHTARHCYKKHPKLLKCDLCGQLGHSSSSCFRKNPCKHCGGAHNSANCHKHVNNVGYFAEKIQKGSPKDPEPTRPN